LNKAHFLSCLVVSLMAMTGAAQAGDQIVGDTSIAAVAVNGGADTVNPGTTCIRVTNPVHAACVGGYLAIPNNNKQLIAAALASKATATRIMLYYNDAAGSSHCPGLVFTPCSVISIEQR
jgi:hypothetical protein